MSVYAEIQAHIDADKAADKARIDEDTMEGARVDIVKQILDIAEHWQDKAESWSFMESYCNQRAIVCQEILDILNDELWEDE